MQESFTNMSPELLRTQDSLLNRVLREDPVWQDYLKHIDLVRRGLVMTETVNETRRVFHYGHRVRGKTLLREAVMRGLLLRGYTHTDTKTEDGLCSKIYTSPDKSRRVAIVSSECET